MPKSYNGKLFPLFLSRGYQAKRQNSCSGIGRTISVFCGSVVWFWKLIGYPGSTFAIFSDSYPAKIRGVISATYTHPIFPYLYHMYYVTSSGLTYLGYAVTGIDDYFEYTLGNNKSGC